MIKLSDVLEIKTAQPDPFDFDSPPVEFIVTMDCKECGKRLFQHGNRQGSIDQVMVGVQLHLDLMHGKTLKRIDCDDGNCFKVH